MTSFCREIDRAMCKIDQHVGTLISFEEKLQREYDSIFESLLNDAGEFDDDELRSFRRLGRLRRLQRRNITTILALQYLRVCLWDMEDGLLPDYELKPEAIERLRSVNEALEGPSRMQVIRTDEAIARNTKELIDASSEQSKTIRFALASVDEDVTRIFGEAIRISAK